MLRKRLTRHPAWRDFWRARPGERFARRYERLSGHDRHPAARAVRAGLGVLLVLVGIVFGVLPGPGFVPALAGLALLAGESERIARTLDAAEVKVRRLLRRG